MLGRGFKGLNRSRFTVVVERDEHQNAMRRESIIPFALIARVDADRDMHTRSAGMHQLGVQRDQIADIDGCQKLDPAHISRYAITSAPIDGTAVAGLVDPFHGFAPVPLAA